PRPRPLRRRANGNPPHPVGRWSGEETSDERTRTGRGDPYRGAGRARGGDHPAQAAQPADLHRGARGIRRAGDPRAAAGLRMAGPAGDEGAALYLLWIDPAAEVPGGLDLHGDGHPLAETLWLVRSGLTRSRRYHPSQRQLPAGTALLVAPPAHTPQGRP